MAGHRGTLTALGLSVALIAAACGDDGSTSEGSDGGPGSGPEDVADCDPTRDAAAGTTEEVFDHDGVERTYRLTVPEGYDGTQATPVVLNMHGFTSNAEQQDLLSGLPEAGAERGYLVVSPQGLDADVPIGDGVAAPFWNITPTVDTSNVTETDLGAADDIGFLNALLDQLEGDLCADPDREYVTGMSNGAAMSMALICTDDERFAAAAPVAGAVFVSDCQADQLTPILAVHGDADVLAPYAGGDTLGFDLGLPSAVGQLSELAELGGCTVEPAFEAIGDDVEQLTWSGCDDGDEVQLYTVLGGGHTWPGSPLFADGVPEPPTGDEAGDDEGPEEGTENIDEVESTFGVDLDTILGEPTETIVATELILDFFDTHA